MKSTARVEKAISMILLNFFGDRFSSSLYIGNTHICMMTLCIMVLAMVTDPLANPKSQMPLGKSSLSSLSKNSTPTKMIKYKLTIIAAPEEKDKYF
eukprot:Skav222378  [mRNA]  locus=scaffold2692:287499:288641:- [translate_table: standard]